MRTPKATSQYATTIPALIWHNNRYRGADIITLSSTCYNEVRGTLRNYYGVSSVHSSSSVKEGKRKHQVYIDF